MEAKKLSVRSAIQLARQGDEDAAIALFSGFIAEDEQIRGSGYLGSMGFIFKEHSFWCVTDRRACSLRLKTGGEMAFSSGYLSHINSDAFYQPSLIWLWLLVALVVIGTTGIGILLIPFMVRVFYRVKKSGVVFWVAEGIPIYVFADRHYLNQAQRVAVLISKAVQAQRNPSHRTATAG